MQISNNFSYNLGIQTSQNKNNNNINNIKLVYGKDNIYFQKQSSSPSFQGNPINAFKSYMQYQRAKRIVATVSKDVYSRPNSEKFLFRNLSMEVIEGLQYGIDVFKGLSMKDIQYLSENLHVIAVKRGCNNMCSHCYADAKPSNREMSWEDFTSITNGFKKLRERLCGFPLFGENLPVGSDSMINKTTELFYDADCMAISVKDKKGKVHDFRDLVTELYNGLGRRSAFDTSGWSPENTAMQKRAEEYVEYFSKPENMDKLNQFNLSFNVFSATNVAAVKAYRAGDIERARRLQDKFSDKIANSIFTFTPFLKEKKFNIMQRSFGVFLDDSAVGFDICAMFSYSKLVKEKVQKLYEKDLNGTQKYIKSKADIEKYMKLLSKKLEKVDTSLNSSGRMKEFMKSFGIKAEMQDHTETTKIMYEDLKNNGRYHRIIAEKLIDADGRVYHMDYARFFPTEIQLNLKNKTAAPRLANLREDCPISSDIINRPEYRKTIDDFI